MLLFQGVTVRVDADGKQQRVAIFSSPRCLGLRYEVEIDRSTHIRLQAMLSTELEVASTLRGSQEPEPDESEGDSRGHARRF